jgi:hypothetical protein
MRKINVFKVSALIIFACLVLSFACYAQENITITTYYPSPDGSYNNLDAQSFRSSKIAVGNANNAVPLPDGVINMVNLGGAPAAATGDLYFGFNPQSLTPNVLNYYDGANWYPIQPAMLVPYVLDVNNKFCMVFGQHAVGVLDINGRSANMGPCDTANGADPYLVGAPGFGGMNRPADAQGDNYITGRSCLPQSGSMICN